VSIREEIQQGLPFAQAAQQYSDDPGSKERGGLYDYFNRGVMVPPFDEAAFSLPLGQVSDPVKTSFGYHLILVEGRKEAGTDSLEQVSDQIREELQQQKAIQAFQELGNSINSVQELQDRYTIKSTPWFSRGDQIEGVPQTDNSMFVARAFSGEQGNVVVAASPRMENLYIIEVIDKQESRIQTLEEAREAVIEDIKQNKATEVAQQMIQTDVEEIRSATTEIQTIAERRGLTLVNMDEPFSRQDQFVPGLGPISPQFRQTAFALQEGEVEGPVQVSQGPAIISLLNREPATLPELEQVREQVENDFRQVMSERLARTAANNFSFELISNKAQLLEAAGTEITSGSTELFSENEPIPGLGPIRELNTATFQLEEIHLVSDPIEVRQSPGFQQQPNQQMPVEAYYIIQLLEIKDSYLPELEEVRDQVVEAYKLKLAEPIAISEANKTLQEIRQFLANTEPESATRTVDLSTFAVETGTGPTYQPPVNITGNGQLPQVGRALQIAKTAFALEPGKISEVITNYRTETDAEGNRSQGEMTGAYIVQVLEKVGQDPQMDQMLQQFEYFRDQLLQSNAVSAWIQEVSAAAKIEYNRALLASEDTSEESQSISGATTAQ
jgi:parvulin-like peptidyl-prolyl isomerase